MEVALRVAGIGPGDEVITTPISWVATANVILAVGARPVFVDIDPRTRNIDLAALEAAITPRTRALMPVYLAGLPVDMDRLYAIAARHGLRVIEDAAQAIGSRWRGRRIGAFGDLVCFSFQANKNITCAEGGCLVLADEAEARVAERLRLQGVVRSGADGMDVVTPGRQVQPDRHRRDDRPGPAAGARPDHEAPRRARRRYFAAARSAGLEALGIELPLPTDPRGHDQLAHVPGRAARRPPRRRPRRSHGGDARSGDRHRRALSGDAPVQLLSRARLARRHAAGRRADRPRHPDAAALSGDDRERRRTRLRPARRGLPRARCRDGAGDLGRHPRLQRGSGAAGAVRPALSGARRAGRALRDHLRQRRQRRPLGGSARRAVRASAPT